MKWQNVGEQPCSVARALSVIGDRWTMLILRNAFVGIRRFDDFQANLGVTRHVLSDRLKRLVEHEILKRTPYQDRQERFEYRLTEKGLELYPVLLTLAAWQGVFDAEPHARDRRPDVATPAPVQVPVVVPASRPVVAKSSGSSVPASTPRLASKLPSCSSWRRPSRMVERCTPN